MLHRISSMMNKELKRRKKLHYTRSFIEKCRTEIDGDEKSDFKRRIFFLLPFNKT